MFWNRLQQGWLVRRVFRRFYDAAMKRGVPFLIRRSCFWKRLGHLESSLDSTSVQTAKLT